MTSTRTAPPPATATMDPAELDRLCINTIRTLSIDAVQAAKSGHPGTPMALAPAAYTLWQRFLRYDPEDPRWPNRDRFVLSNGHASMLLYSLLHLTGVKAVNQSYEEVGQGRLAVTLSRTIPPVAAIGHPPSERAIRLTASGTLDSSGKTSTDPSRRLSQTPL